MSPWTSWSACSVSCGLGSLFRQRDILREALPGGACGAAQFDSRACFPRACPGLFFELQISQKAFRNVQGLMWWLYSLSSVVDGHWSEWTDWSECDAKCGGGVKQRKRTCTAPPPKNGGRDCEGMISQSQSCNIQPCSGDIGTHTGDSALPLVFTRSR